MRRLAVLLAAAVAVLAACGGSKGDSPAAPGSTSGPAVTAAPRTTSPSGSSGATTSPSTGGPSSAAAPGSTTPASSAATWTTFGGDLRRGNAAAQGPDPAKLAPAWSTTLDGDVYGQPLVDGDLVLVATEANTVYGLRLADGGVAWKAELGTPVPRSALPCGNIDPTGITGTPVLDPSTSTVYAVAYTQPFRHDLVALDARSGTVRWRKPIDPPGLSPQVEQQRSALALVNGWVIVPFGGLFGDCGNYKGAVIALRADGTGALRSWTVPTTRMGGIWAPSGAAADATGNLYVATGNAASSDPARYDLGNSVVRLDPDLQQADTWAPTDWAQLSDRDADLGSLGPVLLDGGRVFVAGKNGKGYLLAADRLGGVGGELTSVQACRAAFGGAAVSGGRIVVGCTDGPVALDRSGDRLTKAWQGPSGRSGAPLVTGTVVWVVQNDGHLRGLDLASGQVRADVGLGASVPGFPTPVVAGSRLVVPAGSTVRAFTG